MEPLKDKTEQKIEDFNILKKIGSKNENMAFLVEHKETKSQYALKCYRKDNILNDDKLEMTTLEKDIMNLVKIKQHPFLMKSESTFQNKERVFFLTKFIKGGELFHHFVKHKRFSEDKVRFITAQITLALGYLHEH